MIISRVKQGLRFIFFRYNSKNNTYIKKFLSEEEFKIFLGMSEYEKIHSFNLLKLLLKDEILKNDKIYLKLALLHDCGKKNYSLFKRIKKVLIGDKELELHSENSYKKLKDINLDLANLAKIHHDIEVDEKMKIFKNLDDK